MSNFWRGFLVCDCMISLFSDFLGRDAYSSYVYNNWVDSAITVPIAIGVLFFLAVEYLIKKRLPL